MFRSNTLRRLLALLVMIGVVAGAAACGSDTTDDRADPPAQDSPSATSIPGGDDAGDEEEIPADAFPVTVSAANGDITVAGRPQRIVSLSAALTEMIFAVGAGDQVVAADEYSNYPPEVPTTDLSGFRPNAEAIIGYQPDLVFVSSNRDGIVESLQGVGLTVVHLTSADSVDHALEQVGVVAAATGHADAGETLTADLRDRLDQLTAADAEPVTYYYELSDTYHSATSDSFIGSLLVLANFTSIADGVGDGSDRYPQLSAEFILGAEPDFILVAVPEDPAAKIAEIAARPGWAQLDAVREGRVIVLEQDIATRWGPRIVELLATVVEAAETSELR